MLPRLAKNKTNLLNSYGEFSTLLIITEYSVLFWQTKKETAYVTAPVPATVDQQYVKEKKKGLLWYSRHKTIAKNNAHSLRLLLQRTLKYSGNSASKKALWNCW